MGQRCKTRQIARKANDVMAPKGFALMDVDRTSMADRPGSQLCEMMPGLCVECLGTTIARHQRPAKLESASDRQHLMGASEWTAPLVALMYDGLRVWSSNSSLEINNASLAATTTVWCDPNTEVCDTNTGRCVVVNPLIITLNVLHRKAFVSKDNVLGDAIPGGIQCVGPHPRYDNWAMCHGWPDSP